MTHSLMEADDPDPVNISAILDQFMIGYDKGIRPNYVQPAWLRSNINTHGQFLAPSSLETMLRKTLCLTKTSVGQFFPSMKILGVNRMEAKIVCKKTY